MSFGGAAWILAANAMNSAQARRTLIMVGRVLITIALIVFGRSSGATAPYLSLKMAYLAIYPMAIAASALLALAWRAALRPAAAARYAWQRGDR